MPTASHPRVETKGEVGARNVFKDTVGVEKMCLKTLYPVNPNW